MELIMQFIGSAGYPTSFVAAAVFFLFWHHKMLKDVQASKTEELERYAKENRDYREARDIASAKMTQLEERAYRAEMELEMYNKYNPKYNSPPPTPNEEEKDDG